MSFHISKESLQEKLKIQNWIQLLSFERYVLQKEKDFLLWWIRSIRASRRWIIIKINTNSFSLISSSILYMNRIINKKLKRRQVDIYFNKSKITQTSNLRVYCNYNTKAPILFPIKCMKENWTLVVFGIIENNVVFSLFRRHEWKLFFEK